MKKRYLKLTPDQIKRGVIFSSELKGGGMIHEVTKNDPDRDKRIQRLLDDSFFNNSGFKVNEIRK